MSPSDREVEDTGHSGATDTVRAPSDGPTTSSLLARLVGVPLMIVGVIVGSAVIVVLSFGSITTERERPLDELVSVLEAGSGEKTAGVLLPGEKELWQMAQELGARLTSKDRELTAEELESLVDRLSAALARDAEASATLTEMGRKKMHFMMRALAATELPAAVGPLIAMLSDGDPSTRREALAALSRMRRVTGIGDALPEMIKSLEDSDSVVRTVACVSISTIASSGDAGAIQALRRAYFDDNREVKWNAALGLARLGSSAGKSLLLDMLSRDYWEDEVPIRKETPQGTREYEMPPGKVVQHLLAAIDGVSQLDDAEIREGMEALSRDSAVRVRNAALGVLENRRPVAASRSEG